jgi:hypothetical protein
MQVKEVKVIMYMILHNRPDAKTKKEIAQALNDQHRMELLTKTYPAYIDSLTVENILDVREFEVKERK